MPKILGLDVSKSSVSACLLTSPITDVRSFYYEYPFQLITATKQGIEQLLAFDADIAILEPTGVNYSKIWVEHLVHAGIEVRLVDHKKLRYYRERHLELPDKSDDADALALACYGFEFLESPLRFVSIREELINDLRRLVLRLAHLNKVQSPIINRIRQDLAWQFPEVALIDSIRTAKNDIPLLWGWLAGLRESPRYERLLKESIGLGVTNTVKLHAERICHLQVEEAQIERKIDLLLNRPHFTAYRKALSVFRFGKRTEALLLSQIYPFSRYLEDGQPIIQVRRGRVSGKLTHRYLSERRFLKSLGVAPTEESSGDKQKKRVSGGSALCRKYLWLWVFTTIEPVKNRSNNVIGKQLSVYIDTHKARGTPVQLARSRTAAKAAKLLYKELVKNLC